ncbi:MAG: hypothetical protein ACOYBM_01900, partial [Dethiobacteria bacterium]
TAAFKLGLGTINSIEKSAGASEDQNATAQVDSVIAAVLFDVEGKVADVIIDTAQTVVEFGENMQVVSDKEADYPTKKELGDEYGMAEVSEIGKEWYEQIEELEKWMIGKTVDEIKGMDVKMRDENHVAVPDEPELTSRVTITVEDYLAAVEEAYKNAE